ncbi:hypothetical protein GNI_188440 [Gregarina niphandrodes]|uniref:C2H2-type domain-containing protein n=1 Tax=Gregarina niphandrodes TaxID=110365 RepID=A0A023AWH1_GRENI|nr:hypothetical protein GNI_188440 [Gregarina niphandrodes]EZG43096.1 hypothetical protein GNI_188440 [Gregarina niphandrodes]|eukprot:XP_011134670.1 hypothetical protein GNI_188440 [Gregarina niphandrodes]
MAGPKVTLRTLQFRKDVVRQVRDRLRICLHCEQEQHDRHLMRKHYRYCHAAEYQIPKALPILCVGCKRILPHTYYRVHRCKVLLTGEQAPMSCKACGELMMNPELSVHMIECRKPADEDIDPFKKSKHDYDGIRCLEQRMSDESEEADGQRTTMNIRERTLAAVKEQLMTCVPCDKHFTTTQAKRRHDEREHNQTTGAKGNPVWCTGCHKHFSGSSAYIRHVCPDTDKETEEDQCDGCSIRSRNPALSLHRLTEHM